MMPLSSLHSKVSPSPSVTTLSLPHATPQPAATPTCHVEHDELRVCARPLHGVLLLLLLRGAQQHLHHLHGPAWVGRASVSEVSVWSAW